MGKILEGEFFAGGIYGQEFFLKDIPREGDFPRCLFFEISSAEAFHHMMKNFKLSFYFFFTPNLTD